MEQIVKSVQNFELDTFKKKYPIIVTTKGFKILSEGCF